jgi:alpha-1,3-rhamnosyl/mannosyltransferase
VAQFAGIDLGMISAVPMGVGPAFAPVNGEDLQRLLLGLNLPVTGYGLALAALEPRKRIDRLIMAWRLMPDELRYRYPLVIAGAPGWKHERLMEEIASAVDEGWLISLGYVSEASLPALYSGARLFGYPSLYEGFGMPPIEAMACGVPVAVANSSCLPEVTKGAAMLIDPEDLEGTAEALAIGLTDNAWRAAAISRGLKVASSLTWQSCIAETIDIYVKA